MAAGDLCTLADVKQYLNITGNVDDALLGRLITAVSSRIAQYIQRNIGTGSITETRNGSGTSSMYLGRWPVTAVASVVVNGTTIPAAANGSSGYSIQLWDGVTIPIKEPVLQLTGGWGMWQGTYGPGAWGCFPVGQNNVIVTYTAGFATVPADITEACIQLVVQTYNQRLRIGQNTVNQATQSINFEIKMWPAVVEMLAPYIRVTPLTL
jgi:hypothetical protein